MNSDYILAGKGQITLHRPDWAAFSAARDNAALDSTALDSDVSSTDSSAAVKKTFNAFTHSGSKKSVGPETDTVDFTFDDFIDTINPLQHIPLVNMLYREMTGDKIAGVSQVAGSALYWGPLGIVSGAIDAIIQQETGNDIGETVVASLFGDDKHHPTAPTVSPQHAPETLLADAAPAAAAPISNAAKQPFGGVMDNAIANAAPISSAPISNTPIAHPAVADNNSREKSGSEKKMYSLAGIPRHVGSPAAIPKAELADVRLKSSELKAAQLKKDPLNPEDLNKLLGLKDPAAAIATAPTAMDDTYLPNVKLSAPGLGDDGITPSGNTIPQELIHDMMLMNMQKYQDGLKGGGLRGGSVDVKG